MTNAQLLPDLNITDKDLGVGPLHEIMPDSWNNIAWVIQNSIEIIKEQFLDLRYYVEQIQVNSKENQLANLRRTHFNMEKL